jgi:hypothetical protein
VGLAEAARAAAESVERFRASLGTVRRETRRVVIVLQEFKVQFVQPDARERVVGPRDPRLRTFMAAFQDSRLRMFEAPAFLQRAFAIGPDDPRSRTFAAGPADPRLRRARVLNNASR